MVEIIREFLVKEEARGHFELAFGPGGAWSNLFGQCKGFRGTTLLRGIKDRRRYVSVELWDTEEQREQALAGRQAEYSSLDANFAEWTESQTEVGVFQVLAEATIRPRARTRRQ